MHIFWEAPSSKWIEWSQGTSKDKGTGERQRAGGNETFVLSPESAHGGGRSSASHKVVAKNLWRLRRSDLLDDTAGTEGDAIVRGKFHDLLRAQNLSTSPSPRSSSKQRVSEWVEHADFVRLFGCFFVGLSTVLGIAARINGYPLPIRRVSYCTECLISA